MAKKVSFKPCSRVSFPSQTMLVDEVLRTMVKNNLNLHVLPNFAYVAIVSTSFNLWMSRGSVDTFAIVII
jgi:hypothetical protein